MFVISALLLALSSGVTVAAPQNAVGDIINLLKLGLVTKIHTVITVRKHRSCGECALTLLSWNLWILTSSRKQLINSFKTPYIYSIAYSADFDGMSYICQSAGSLMTYDYSQESVAS
jgi:hypothetical protein